LNFALHPEAKEELREAAIYYSPGGTNLVRELFSEYRSEVKRILANPYLFNIRPNGFRRANLDRFPFYLPFLIKDETVYILAVAHISRRPDYWTHRTSSL